MDVYGFTAHAFAAFAQNLDLDEIVVAGREAELGRGSVGEGGVDVVVSVSLQYHLDNQAFTKLNYCD